MCTVVGLSHFPVAVKQCDAPVLQTSMSGEEEAAEARDDTMASYRLLLGWPGCISLLVVNVVSMSSRISLASSVGITATKFIC